MVVKFDTSDKEFYRETVLVIRLGMSSKGNRDRYNVTLNQGFDTTQRVSFDVATSSPVGLIIKGLMKWFRGHVIERGSSL